MFPELKLGSLAIPMYAVMIAVGIILAVAVFIKICQRDKIPNAAVNFYINILLVSIALGFVFAYLFQALYNWIDLAIAKKPVNAETVFTGMTFLGGLIGGVSVFFLCCFIFKRPAYKEFFPRVCCNILCCIALAHAFGRIGCFFAGCCYGKVTDSWIGVHFKYYDREGVLQSYSYKRLPTQLFESAFLFALFAVLLRFRGLSFCIYPMGYGVWRFFLEYFRDDYRGSFVPGLSPSQFQSLLLVALGLTLLIVYLVRKRRAKPQKS